MKTLEFHSCLALEIQRFISLHQLSGTDYQSQARLLWYFDHFLSEEKLEEPRLTRQITDRYLETLSHLAPRVRCNRFGVVRHVCQYLSQTDPHAYVPESIRKIPSQEAHRPYIYSKSEIGALLAAASELLPQDSIRPHTYKTLLGLLYSTGIRIGEACALNLEDFYGEEQLLYIAQGKFHKTR
ncbi:MAG: tyrosine-type recombinase/integrase, partial [Gorillibacterium sp.]|nr:tyrosine-type recombinase/integrase [Gorillibacterium sp.]